MTITDRVKIISITTVAGIKPGEDKVERIKLEVPAPNEILARQRARFYLRSQYPTAKNIVNPAVISKAESEQSSLREFMPETLKQKDYTVELLLVR